MKPPERSAEPAHVRAKENVVVVGQDGPSDNARLGNLSGPRKEPMLEIKAAPILRENLSMFVAGGCYKVAALGVTEAGRGVEGIAGQTAAPHDFLALRRSHLSVFVHREGCPLPSSRAKR
jgi:hypothetical protein